VAPNDALDFQMRAAVHTSGGVMAALGQKGDTSVPFTISGTASNPVFRPDMKAIVNQKLNALTGGAKPADAAKGLLNSLFGKQPQR
jgi:hypothetical protein